MPDDLSELIKTIKDNTEAMRLYTAAVMSLAEVNAAMLEQMIDDDEDQQQPKTYLDGTQC